MTNDDKYGFTVYRSPTCIYRIVKTTRANNTSEFEVQHLHAQAEEYYLGHKDVNGLWRTYEYRIGSDAGFETFEQAIACIDEHIQSDLERHIKDEQKKIIKKEIL